MSRERKDDLFLMIRQGRDMTLPQEVRLALMLGAPAILSQLTTTMMQYIDASMVGSLGAGASAAIGLIETTTWLIGSLGVAAAAGFHVQVSHRLGAGKPEEARQVLRQGMVSVLVFSATMALIALAVSPFLPGWLGGGGGIAADASRYFAIYSLFIPLFQFSMLAAGMLRSSGNVMVPCVASVFMLVLDVVFNFFLIFPTRTVGLWGLTLHVPGVGLGVTGAAIGTGLAEAIAAAGMMHYLCFKPGDLRISRERGRFVPTRAVVREAFRIGMPMGLQQFIMCSAYICTTIIVAPLGTAAIAAHSLSIIVESLCYMPGYGMADAATTLVGQCMGARRRDLMKRFAWIAVALGMAVMAVMGVVMYVGAPHILATMTPSEEVRRLGTSILRIEAFAEPMFAAAIVCYGAFVGASSTLVPSGMNLLSMWLVRIPLSAVLAGSMGLRGVWVAMCAELCFRGVIFLCHLKRGSWMRRTDPEREEDKPNASVT